MTPDEAIPNEGVLSLGAKALEAETPARGKLTAPLAPSVADLLFVLVLTFAFLASEQGWQRLFLDGDTGLHIRIGDLILATGSVPTTDPFSFSLPGREWFAFEWGSEALFAWLHQGWGLKGVALLSGVVLAATFGLLFLSCIRHGANGGLSVLLALLTASASLIHFHARPHIFTLLFFTLALWMLERDRRRPDRWIWAFVPLACLWANLHGGFLMLVAVIGLYAVADGIVARVFPLRLTLLGAACAAATLVNPYGYKLHQHILETMSAKWLIDMVDEFKSPSFRGEAMLIYMAALFTAIGLLGRLLRQRKLRDAFLLLFLSRASLTSVRHVPLFLLAAIPVIAVELTAVWQRAIDGLPRASVLRILDDVAVKFGSGPRRLTPWSAVFVLYLALSPSMVWPRDFDASLFPTRLVARQAAVLTEGRLFTTDQWNDYLVYHFYPRQRVFIDGRHNYYGETLVRNFAALVAGTPSWHELLVRYQFDRILVPRQAALTALLRTDPAWREIDSDKQAVLFVREPRP